MSCPSPADKGSVLLPITSAVAEEARLTGVPETVIAEPPGDRVWLPTMYSDAELAVIIWPPMVMGGAAVIGPELLLRGMVELPMTIYEADEAREIVVPDAVMAGPPGVRVCPAITIGDVGLTVKADPWNVKVRELGAGVTFGP